MGQPAQRRVRTVPLAERPPNAVFSIDELIEGVTPEKGRALIEWLRNARPDAVNGDEMQQLFGDRRSFDWAITEDRGAVGPYPAFQPLGTVGGETDS